MKRAQDPVLHVRCAFCPTLITYHLTPGFNMTVGRKTTFDNKLKCPNCDSVTVVEFHTKRKSKGKRLKQQEKVAQEKLLVEIDRVREVNAKLGDVLLAQEGCTCQEYLSGRGRSNYLGRDSGHPLSTGWNRRDWAGGVVPSQPQHLYTCPLRHSHAEAAAQREYPQEPPL